MSECIDLTIAIPTKNEEKNLEGCLKAIGIDFAKKIVIVDSGSTDKTIQIAERFGVEIIDFKWNGQFPKKRNWFLRTHTPKTSWVLFLDADEYITESFKIELRKLLAKNDKAGYWLNYRIYFLGKPLLWGYPLQKLALFKVGEGEYEKIDEEQWSKLDMEIHEHPIIVGSTGVIKSKIDHLDNQSTYHYVMKHNEYSDWEASRYLQNIIKNRKHFTWKQKIKYAILRSPFSGFVYFFANYIFLGGFLDGYRGLVFSILKMSYFTQVYCKIVEKEK